MKKLVSVLLAAAMVLSLAALAGCHKDDYVPEGPTDVDYGEVKYVRYDDGSALTSIISIASAAPPTRSYSPDRGLRRQVR